MLSIKERLLKLEAELILMQAENEKLSASLKKENQAFRKIKRLENYSFLNK